VTPKERRIAFLHGILTNCKLTMDHAVKLAYDREDGKPTFEESRLVWDASEAVEKAQKAIEKRVSAATVWPEDEDRRARK